MKKSDKKITAAEESGPRPNATQIGANNEYSLKKLHFCPQDNSTFLNSGVLKIKGTLPPIAAEKTYGRLPPQADRPKLL